MKHLRLPAFALALVAAAASFAFARPALAQDAPAPAATTDTAPTPAPVPTPTPTPPPPPPPPAPATVDPEPTRLVPVPVPVEAAPEPPLPLQQPPVDRQDTASPTNPFAPAPGASGRGTERGDYYLHVQPFAIIVGGGKYDHPIQPPSSTRNDRVSALMIADFGVRGELADWISFESEIMANGGPRLHGTSVYDGQAALQVRKQVLHLGKKWWMVEVGRVVDEASVDYFSAHVADTLMQDTATRDSLLFSGFNLGNGVRGTAEVLPGLRLGLAANAGNPTSTSSVLAVGGSFPPYDRIFFQAAQRTRQDLNGYPDDQFHAYVLTPSAMYGNEYVDAKASVQMFVIDPNANDDVARSIRGYNARGNLRAHLFGNVVSPFVNFSLDRNDVVDPANVTKLSADKYTGLAKGFGVDFNYQKRFGNDNGIGVQYVDNQFKVGDGPLTTIRYFNVGTTYWLGKHVAAGARFALWSSEQKDQNANGERSVLLTMRLVL